MIAASVETTSGLLVAEKLWLRMFGCGGVGIVMEIADEAYGGSITVGTTVVSGGRWGAEAPRHRRAHSITGKHTVVEVTDMSKSGA